MHFKCQLRNGSQFVLTWVCLVMKCIGELTWFGLIKYSSWIQHINSLWPSDAIWRFWSTLGHVMACCLMVRNVVNMFLTTDDFLKKVWPLKVGQIWKSILLTRNINISTQISLEFLPYRIRVTCTIQKLRNDRRWKHIFSVPPNNPTSKELTHRDLVMPYSVINLGHCWFRQWLVAYSVPRPWL